jgi:hypothetical protein
MMTKEQRKEYMKNWRQSNKEETSKYKRDYKAKNTLKIKKYKENYRLKNRIKWREGAIERSDVKAEVIIRTKILPNLGYTDIYKPTERFCFDALCKKNNQIYAVEITTSSDKIFRKHKNEFMDYFKLPLLLFFVRPNLSEYWLIFERGKLSNRTFNYKQGRNFQIP